MYICDRNTNYVRFASVSGFVLHNYPATITLITHNPFTLDYFISDGYLRCCDILYQITGDTCIVPPTDQQTDSRLRSMKLRTELKNVVGWSKQDQLK